MRSANVVKVNEFSGWLGARLRGQPEVLKALDEHFGRSELGLTDPSLPLGAFLFVGPTGVGKTEATKLFTEYFHGKEGLARLDMSEFKTREAIAELRMRMTAFARGGKRTFLYDEIEKAHPEAIDLLLQILDYGHAGGTDGQPIDFRGTYQVMTSNLGAAEAMRSRTQNYTMFSNTVMEYVRRGLRPELLGRVERIGSVHVFRKLEEPQQREIATFHIGRTVERMAQHGAEITLTPEAFEFIIRNGFHPLWGARPLLGVIARSIEGAVAAAIREGKPLRGELAERPDRLGLLIREAVGLAAA